MVKVARHLYLFLEKLFLGTKEEERRKSLDELFPFVKEDIKNTLEIMDGLPVTIRTLDPPLHANLYLKIKMREKV